MKLAILFGGSSYEHEISIVSAITMKKVFKTIDLGFIFVDEYREFYWIESDKMVAQWFSMGAYRRSKKLTLKKGGFYIDGFFGSKKVAFDTLLNLIHGRDGEDGKIASIMEFFGIPYLSPRLEASALSYNKLYTKLLANRLNIKTISYQLLHREEERKVTIPYPVIIKPVRLGSSIGVSVVKSEETLHYALDVAFEFDNEVIIEPFIEGVKEYNQAGCYTDKWELSVVEEPQKEEFLDFEKKYMDFRRDSVLAEASLEESLKTKLQESFKTIYGFLFRGSIIRCDFFVIDGEVYLNEINPIPGSIANYLFEDFEAIVIRLITHLSTEKEISIDYQYIHSIQSAKGKA